MQLMKPILRESKYCSKFIAEQFDPQKFCHISGRKRNISKQLSNYGLSIYKQHIRLQKKVSRIFKSYENSWLTEILSITMQAS